MDGGRDEVEGRVHVLGLLPHVHHDPLRAGGNQSGPLGIALYNDIKIKRDSEKEHRREVEVKLSVTRCAVVRIKKF